MPTALRVIRSLRCDARLLHDLPPFGQFRLYELAEVGRAHLDDLSTLVHELRLYAWRGLHLADRLGQRLDDRRRRAGRRDEAPPARRRIARQARVADGGN